MEPLVLDIKSKLGVFNRPSSNTGGLLTYRIPPKTAIKGMLGSILGLRLPETLKTFRDMRYSVKPLSPFETVNLTFNCHYGGRKGRMVNIQQEVLVNPKYRIYLELPNSEIQKNIKKKINSRFKFTKSTKGLKNTTEEVLLKNKSYYTLYMGKNTFPAKYNLKSNNLEKIDENDIRENEKFIVNSVIPKKIIKKYDIDLNRQMGNKWDILKSKSETFRVYNIPQLPKKQNKDRNFKEFEEVLLKETSRGTLLKVEIKKNKLEGLSLYKKGKELIVCF